MPIKQIPYEFLARWDHKTGALKGAHVKFYEEVSDATGKVIGGKEGDAMSVSVAGSKGYPLADILSALQTTALVKVETDAADTVVALAAKDAEIEAKDAEIALKITELNAKEAELVALREAV